MSERIITRKLIEDGQGHPAPRPYSGPRSYDPDLDRQARAAIARAIHERDGIVLGLDPLGRRCSCPLCLEPTV